MAAATQPTATQPAAARPATLSPAARNLRRLALAALLIGPLLLIAAAAIATTYLRQAIAEQVTEDGYLLVRGTVVGERTGFMAAVTKKPDGTLTRTYQLQPQVRVQYVLNGEELESWVDVPISGTLNSDIPSHHALAQNALADYYRGQSVGCSYDPAAPMTLMFASGDGGRRTTILGCVLAAFCSLPGIGLILTGCLLWRLSKPRPVVAV